MSMYTMGCYLAFERMGAVLAVDGAACNLSTQRAEASGLWGREQPGPYKLLVWAAQ